MMRDETQEDSLSNMMIYISYVQCIFRYSVSASQSSLQFKSPIMASVEPQICDACRKPKYKDKDLLKCGRCKQAFYHNKICQKRHWSEHKGRCKLLQQHPKNPQQLIKQFDEEIKSVQVQDSDDKGRVVVALKDLSPGDTVLLERPAILFDTRLEYRGLLEAFGRASLETREEILDLYAPPIREIDSRARQQRHARLEQQRQAHLKDHPEHVQFLSVAITHKLLAIIECNAHQLFNASLLPGSMLVDPKQWMGLFCMGSMLEHSCNPNLTMNTTRDGKLELIAETFIAAGERVSFSYIEGIYEKCRSQRQVQLHTEKHFICQCSRCNGLDECRPIMQDEECNICTKAHPFFWDTNHQEYVCVMVQNQCNALKGRIPEEVLQKDFEIAKKIRSLEQQLEAESNMRGVLKELAEVMTSVQWKKYVHQLHWLRLSASQMLSTLVSATARVEYPSNAPSLLRLSVLALLHNVAWLEQVLTILRGGAETRTNLKRFIGATNRNALSTIESAIQASLSSIDTIHVQEETLKHVMTILCEQSTIETTTSDILLSVFYAGQDLILAGHSDLCFDLYGRYRLWFHKLKQPNDDNRARIDHFLDSQGQINPFKETML